MKDLGGARGWAHVTALLWFAPRPRWQARASSHSSFLSSQHHANGISASRNPPPQTTERNAIRLLLCTPSPHTTATYDRSSASTPSEPQWRTGTQHRTASYHWMPLTSAVGHPSSASWSSSSSAPHPGFWRQRARTKRTSAVTLFLRQSSNPRLQSPVCEPRRRSSNSSPSIRQSALQSKGAYTSTVIRSPDIPFINSHNTHFILSHTKSPPTDIYLRRGTEGVEGSQGHC
jgi:hypothetical protein